MFISPTVTASVTAPTNRSVTVSAVFGEDTVGEDDEDSPFETVADEADIKNLFGATGAKTEEVATGVSNVDLTSGLNATGEAGNANGGTSGN